MLESQYLRDKHWLERQVSFIQEASNLCQSLSDVWLFCDPVGYSSPGSSIHGISQARILEWVAICFSRGSSRPRDRTHVSCISCIGGRIFFFFLTTEPPGKQPGEEANWCLKTKTEDSAQMGKFLKGESFGKQGQSFCYLLLCAGFIWLVGSEVTGWGSRNLALSLKLPSSTWVGALVLVEELKNFVIYLPWWGTGTLPCCFLTAPPLCNPFLPWLAMVGLNLPFETQQGQGGWKKLISYKWEIGNTERICSWEGPTESCSPSFSLMRLPCSPICLFQEGDPSRAQEWALF